MFLVKSFCTLKINSITNVKDFMNTKKLWVYRLLTWWMPESRCFAVKNVLLRWAGAKIGKNVRICTSTRILGTGRLEIGDDVHIGSCAFIMPIAPSSVMIGNHVDIGPQVTILTGSHMIDSNGEHIGGKGISKSVIIGSGSWLGARSIILLGVKIPEKTLVAAGAVVTRSCLKPCMLLAGVPSVEKRCLMFGR